MIDSNHGCAVCGIDAAGGVGMSRAIIQGRALWLCIDHATAVAVAMPKTFEEMRALFIVASTAAPDVGYRIDSMSDRRSPIDRRRRSDDRRYFPPRPEGRRMGLGRRASDPLD